MPDINIRNLKTSAYCPHCHQFTLITVVDANLELHGSIHARCVYRGRVPGRYWWIGECHSCNGVVLVLNNGISIYPRSKPQPSDERIPEEIKYSLDEAKRCFTVEAYCATTVMSRRALQICCVERGANEDKRLVEQIDELLEMGIITKDIKDIAHTVRWIGNDGAHLNPNEVTREDAEEILKLTEQIFYIVYIAPAMAKERMKKRESAKIEEDREEKVE